MPDAGRAARLEALWYGCERPPAGLRLLAAVNSAVVRARGAAYRAGLLATTRVDRPVIVVGNITVGGTGKTPLTAWLAQELRAAGHSPGIASRGYGRRGGELRWVEPDDDPADVGDEPLMLRQQTGVPVCVAARRSEAARRLVSAGCDMVLCDDGLQHLALARDLELAVVDAARGLGNGYLLPAGPLREPAARLENVAAVVLNVGEAQGGEIPLPALPDRVRCLRMSLAPGELRSLASQPDRPLASLAGEAVHAVTGIGNPQRFFALLRASGARVHEHAFPDHHRFAEADIRFGDDLPVIMTAKDAVKCRRFADARHWVLPVRAQFAEDDARWLRQRVLGLARRIDA